jgi:1-acyl-sn-glycerol-3-phosphate acyltransferase
LNHGGSVLIDRKNPKQSIPAIMNFAKYIEKYNRSAIIFAEGTRSRNGKPKRFREGGLKMMVKYAPSSYVVPVTINNSWKIEQFGSFPLGVFNTVYFEVHPPVKSDSMTFEELFKKTEKAVTDTIVV